MIYNKNITGKSKSINLQTCKKNSCSLLLTSRVSSSMAETKESVEISFLISWDITVLTLEIQWIWISGEIARNTGIFISPLSVLYFFISLIYSMIFSIWWSPIFAMARKYKPLSPKKAYNSNEVWLFSLISLLYCSTWPVLAVSIKFYPLIFFFSNILTVSHML